MESFNQNVIKHKTGLLNLAAELGNISKACRVMGFSRDTFYRYRAARDSGGVEALFDVSRRKPNLKNRVEEEATEAALTAFAIDFPAHGQVRASNELRKQECSYVASCQAPHLAFTGIATERSPFFMRKVGNRVGKWFWARKKDSDFYI